MGELDSRKQTILRAVIVEYVALAEPIGSEMLTQKYELGVRSATVRNELAEMAELGYLQQPHTSAGRVPSTKGYRFYVDHLSMPRAPAEDVRQRVRQATSDGDALQDLLRHTARTLSRVTQLMAAATTAREGNVRVVDVVVSALGPERALLVVVLGNGHVENRMIECPPGLTLEQLGLANEALRQIIDGRSLRSITRLKTPTPSGVASLDQLIEKSLTTLKSVARELTRAKVILEGVEFLIGQPEFARDAQDLQEIVRTIEDSESLQAPVSLTDKVRAITIGTENAATALHRITVMRERFYVGEDEAGTIALIGPTRLNYDQSVPLLEFTARAISETLTKLFK